MQVDTPKKTLMRQLKLQLLYLSLVYKPQAMLISHKMGTRKANAMTSGPCSYEMVYKEDKHLSPDAAEHELNTIGRFDMYIREDTCCAGNNWRLLSTTCQLCDVKGFHNSYKEITNVPVDRSATSVVHDDGTVYIIILNEDLLFGKSMYHSLINPNQIRSFGIPLSNDPFERIR